MQISSFYTQQIGQTVSPDSQGHHPGLIPFLLQRDQRDLEIVISTNSKEEREKIKIYTDEMLHGDFARTMEGEDNQWNILRSMHLSLDSIKSPNRFEYECLLSPSSFLL